MWPLFRLTDIRLPHNITLIRICYMLCNYVKPAPMLWLWNVTYSIYLTSIKNLFIFTCCFWILDVSQIYVLPFFKHTHRSQLIPASPSGLVLFFTNRPLPSSDHQLLVGVRRTWAGRLDAHNTLTETGQVHKKRKINDEQVSWEVMRRYGQDHE